MYNLSVSATDVTHTHTYLAEGVTARHACDGLPEDLHAQHACAVGRQRLLRMDDLGNC